AGMGWVRGEVKRRVLTRPGGAGARAGPAPGPRRVAVGGPVDGAAEGGPLDGAVDFEALVASSPGHVIEETVGLVDLCLLPHTSAPPGRRKAGSSTTASSPWTGANPRPCPTSPAARW